MKINSPVGNLMKVGNGKSPRPKTGSAGVKAMTAIKMPSTGGKSPRPKSGGNVPVKSPLVKKGK